MAVRCTSPVGELCERSPGNGWPSADSSEQFDIRPTRTWPPDSYMQTPRNAGQVRTALQGLGLACTFALVFMLLSFARTIGDTGSMQFGDVVIRAAMETPLWGTALGWSFAYFLLVQILGHVAFAAVCWALACLAQKAWPNANASRRQWVLIWLILSSAWILLANATLFPTSSLGEPYAKFAAGRIFGLPLYVAFGACLAVAITACVVLAVRNRRSPGSPFRRPGIAGATLGGCALVVLAAAIPHSKARTSPIDQPHIIVIGIDSLRSELALGPEAKRYMPNLAEFLARSVTFSDAITPLARTFPSWVSILSGKHPHTTGAVVNLLPRDMIQTGATLPQVLREHGYQTFYAIDESRFSNIDETYGFDRVVAPPFGAADFLIGAINDAPLTNLIVNTRVGEWLTPYSHANRAAAMLYDPDTFIERLDREAQFDRPTFFAAHLTLMHWPFSWAGSPKIAAREGAERLWEKYHVAARRVDQQFGDLLTMLRRKGALENAIVIVLSDHGEALGQPDESSYPYWLLGEKPDELQIKGHGTSVFSRNQYQVLLALRSFGNESLVARCGSPIDAPVSLLDIRPSVLDALNIPEIETVDGKSLLPLLGNSDPASCTQAHARIRFTESEFNPRGISPDGPISASALDMARRFYDVSISTGRMEIRREHVPNMLKQRQYAAMLGRTVVAAVPAPGAKRQFRYFAIGPESTTPRELVAGQMDPLDDPNVARLYDALRRRFSIGT